MFLGHAHKCQDLQVLDAVTQRRAQALTPEHLDNLWTKGRNYKKRESEKAATHVVTPLIEKDPVGKANLITPMEARVSTQTTINKDVFTTAEHAKVSLPFPTTVSLSEAIIVSPQKEYKSATEQYGALLFGDSKEVDKILPGIGFSPLPEFCESSQLQYLSSWRSSRRSPEFGKSRSIEDLLDLSRNRRLSTDTSVQSSDTSGSFKLKRQLSHRKSRSMGGEIDWQELGRGESIDGLPPLLNTGDDPRADAMAESEKKIEKPKSSEEVLRPSTQADTAVLTAELSPHFSLSKLQSKVSSRTKLKIVTLWSVWHISVMLWGNGIMALSLSTVGLFSHPHNRVELHNQKQCILVDVRFFVTFPLLSQSSMLTEDTMQLAGFGGSL